MLQSSRVQSWRAGTGIRKNILLYLVMAAQLATSVHANETINISAPPSIWVQQHGEKLAGPIIILLEGIFAEMDIAVRAKPLPWARAISQLKTGELDMIPVIFRTNARARHMVFTIPYIDVPTAVFVPLNKSFSFKTLEDLKGKKGLMMRGDSISAAFEAFEPMLDLSRLATYEQLIRMLADQRADYGVAAQYGLIIEAKKLGYDHKIKVLPVPISLRSLHIAFSKKSKFLNYLPEVNNRLKQMQMDGTLDKMVKDTIRIAAGDN